MSSCVAFGSRVRALRGSKGPPYTSDSRRLSRAVPARCVAPKKSKSKSERGPTPCHALRSGKRKGPTKERDEVLRLANTQNCGIDHSAGDRKAMELAVDALIDVVANELNDIPDNTTPELLSARWRLAWTSEQETLFLLKTWPGPGSVVQKSDPINTTTAYQIIDVGNKTLINSVVFCNGNRFDVDSRIEIEDKKRVAFQFTNASLKLKKPINTTLNLPPVGKGWFDTVYVDETMRVARDSRGDTLVVVRD